MSRLGKALRRFRKKNKLTQDALAARLGLARASLAHLEAGSRGVSTEALKRISEQLDIPAGDLL